MSIRLALVHLNKPHDVAVVAQVVLAAEVEKIFFIGNGVDFLHPKVVSKVMSWNIDPMLLRNLSTAKMKTLGDVRKEGLRLIGTSPDEKTISLFSYEPQDNDVFVLGGANGLSQADRNLLDMTIKIPCSNKISFLTVSTVVPILVYYVIGKQRR